MIGVCDAVRANLQRAECWVSLIAGLAENCTTADTPSATTGAKQTPTTDSDRRVMNESWSTSGEKGAAGPMNATTCRITQQQTSVTSYMDPMLVILWQEGNNSSPLQDHPPQDVASDKVAS